MFPNETTNNWWNSQLLNVKTLNVRLRTLFGTKQHSDIPDSVWLLHNSVGLKVHFFTSNNNIKVIGPVRRLFFSAVKKIWNYCFPWVETLHAQSTKPVGFKKSKIIEFRSLIRNIELFEVLTFSKNQRFCRKIGDLKKKHSCFL